MCMQAAAPVWRSSASLGPRPRSRLKEPRQEAMQEACRASAHVRLRVAIGKRRQLRRCSRSPAARCTCLAILVQARLLQDSLCRARDALAAPGRGCCRCLT